jgi:hypothetical protein
MQQVIRLSSQGPIRAAQAAHLDAVGGTKIRAGVKN